jgi:hypothetical protein
VHKTVVNAKGVRFIESEGLRYSGGRVSLTGEFLTFTCNEEQKSCPAPVVGEDYWLSNEWALHKTYTCDE